MLTYTNYFAFGMDMPGRGKQSASYRYGFNGKENDNEVQQGDGNSHDFGARMYDPRLGGWLSLDPLMHLTSNWSPYVFCFNNPILMFDPDGAWPLSVWARSFISASRVGGGKFRGDDNGNFQGVYDQGNDTYVSPDAWNKQIQENWDKK